MLVVIGGHSRNIGKTSVVAGLIHALPKLRWTAIKITQYGHGVCSTEGSECGCADPVHPFAVDEEADPGSGTDSSRYLAAGAARSYWVRTAAGQLGYAMPALKELIASSEHCICESNSLLQYLRPDLFLPVLDLATEDFKDSTRLYLDRADAVLLLHGERGTPSWSGVSGRLWSAKPRISIAPPEYITDELVRLVAARARDRGGLPWPSTS